MSLPAVTLGTTELEVSPLCLGGNVFGWTADESSSFAVLDAYVEAGGNFIDTADVYSRWAPGNHGGESEAIIGRWMRSRGNRDQLVLASKVGSMGPLTGEHIRPQLEESLARLGTDRIDLYYAHRDDPLTPLDATLAALQATVEAGHVRHLAASNYEPPRLRALLELAEEAGPRFVALQPLYNLMQREEYEGQLEAVCEQHQLACLPYQALAGGFLTGKYRPGEAIVGARADEVSPHANACGWRVLDALQAIAAARQVSVAACSVAWLAAQPTVVAPIVSATTPAQLRDLLAFSGVVLTAAELSELDLASRPAAAAA